MSFLTPYLNLFSSILVKKTKKQECRPKEVGRFSSKAKGRDQMEVTLDRPWDLGTENVDIDQGDVAESSNLQSEMETAQLLHNSGDKKGNFICICPKSGACI